MEEELGKILNDILDSETVKEWRRARDIKGEIEFYGHRLRLVDEEENNLVNFFEDYEGALKINSVWEWLKPRLKEDLDDLFLDVETFRKNIGWNLEDETNERLEYLCDRLCRLLRERHRNGWRALTLEDAKKMLAKEKGTFVVLLDKDGRCLDEPYPVWANPEAKVKIKIEQDSMMKHERIVAEFDQPQNCLLYTSDAADE